MERLMNFIPRCNKLHILRLHNNGLGIQGARQLASALSALACQPGCGLETFICGRNRLEDEGAKVIAAAFKGQKTLKEVQMPQNGIRGEGIVALMDGLKTHTNMQILNLNDNAFLDRSSIVASQIFLELKNLEVVNIGDCILRDSGLREISSALASLANLRFLDISSNELTGDATVELFEHLRDNSRQLEYINISDNDIEYSNKWLDDWINVVASEIILDESETSSSSEYDEQEDINSHSVDKSEPEIQLPLPVITTVDDTIDRLVLSTINQRLQGIASGDTSNLIDCLFELSVIKKTDYTTQWLSQLSGK
ncbi:hypothetical protein ACOME3_009161 [Neoechinorhynchus agilis]